MPFGNAKKTPLEKLNGFRDEYSEVARGFRESIRRLTCETFKIAIKIQKSEEHRMAFFKLVPMLGWGRNKTIPLEAMVFVMGAKSRSQRQIAWKRVRAVEYLHNNGIELDALEEELENRGGLEAVAREAARVDPRRDRECMPQDVSDEDNFKVDKVEDDSDPDDDADDTGDVGGIGGRSHGVLRTNDELITLVAAIRASDRAQIEDSEAGTKLLLKVSRSKGGGPLVKILEVKPS